MLTGVLIWLLVEELPRGSAEPELAGLMTHENEKQFQISWKDMVKTLKIPTIWAAILQGITGTMPWVVMGVYFINWMVKDLGYANEITFSNPNGSAPLIFAIIVVGAAISSLLGGIIGDYAEKLNPKYGRTIIGQFSVLVGVPLMYVLLTQAKNMSFWQMFGLALITALLIGWPGRGAKEPMMQAVVPPEMRSSAYSVVNLIEGGLSSFAGIIAGSLADSIGLTTLFYFTYPKDALKVRQMMGERRDDLLNKQTS
jgi:succinate dehydrogenase/fumarate reductase cytochrome b subunit